jgi:spermidine synthase
MLDKDKWVIEVCEEAGSAFALRKTATLHEEQTPYQHIAIHATEQFGHIMVIDGCYMLTARDNFIYHEMMSHPALFSHPDPAHVVIIGGGDCGTLREVLRHEHVRQATQVEIDERVTRLSEQFFPELCSSNHDPRASLLFTDGIQWMREAEAGSIDVVIIDSTDPVGPAEGLFTEAFYRDCHRALGDNGVLVQQSESPLVHMDILRGMHRAMRAAGFADTRTLFFPQPCYPTGWWSATMAGKQDIVAGFQQTRARALPFETRYYTADMHRAALTPPAFFPRALRGED